MKYRLLSLYVLISSALFSGGLFLRIMEALRGLDFFEPQLAGGVTGNAVFHSIRKRHDLFTYYSSLIVVPALAVFFWFILFRYPAERLSTGRKKYFLLLSKTLALPFSLWYFTIPGASFFGEGFTIKAVIFIASAIITIAALGLSGAHHKKVPGTATISAFLIYPVVLYAVIDHTAGTLTLSIATALLLAVFWLYQTEPGSPGKKSRRNAALLAAISSLLMIAGAFISARRTSVTVYAFIFFYALIAGYLLSSGGKDGAGEGRGKTFAGVPPGYHLAVLFYGYTLGAFFFSNYGAALVTGAVLWAVFTLAYKSRMASRLENLTERTLLILVSLSPVALFYLKAPLYITLFGRYSDGTWIYAFNRAVVLVTGLLCVVFYLLFRRTGREKMKKAALWILPVSAALVTYSALFNPYLDGFFDYFHEAESLVRASLFSRGYGFMDLYLVEHGLIQDLGIGLLAERLFGATLEGLRTLLMYLNPVSAVSIFILCFTLFKKKSLAFTAFITAMAVILTSPVKASPYPLIHKNFLRLIMPSLSIAFFSLYMQKKRYYLIILSSAAAFASVLWSIDTGLIAISAIALSALILDFNEEGFSAAGYRTFPIFLAAQAVILVLVLLLFGTDFLSVYAEVFARQSGVVQTSAHAGLYPVISGISRKTFFLAYVNPAIIIFSLSTLLWLAVQKRWSEKDLPFFTLTVFSAAFFVRGIGRTDSDHIIFCSAYVPIVLTLGAERLSFFLLKGRGNRYHGAVTLALILFLVVPYSAQRHVFFPLKTYKNLTYEKSGQRLETEKIGNVAIGDFQAEGINLLLDFFSRNRGAPPSLYDFTNNYGITLWVLGAKPVTRFLFVANANTVDEQRDVIQALNEKRPRYVLFDGKDFFSRFDGMDNFVRHPLVADYILKNYLPYARVLNYRILKRKDLVEWDGKELSVKTTAGDEYTGTLSGRDLFSAVDLGFIPYYLSKGLRRSQLRPLLALSSKDTGDVELKGLDLSTEKVSGVIIEASGASREARIFWSDGSGYFQDQSIVFSLENDGKSHEYSISDLSSIPSWHYLKSVRSIKVTAAAHGDFKVERVELLE